MLTIGMDIGGSTTKVVALGDACEPLYRELLTTGEPEQSLRTFFERTGVNEGEVSRVCATGVGSFALQNRPLSGLPTCCVDEFVANGLGATYDLRGGDACVVVSAGTGTSLVECCNGRFRHIGGLSVGGGTLEGLSSLLLGTTDIGRVAELAERGDISHINLTIGDVCAASLEGLPEYATASAFGKLRNSSPSKADVALGLIWMVLETIGSGAVLSQRSGKIRRFVIIGGLSRLPQCRLVFPLMERLYGVEFVVSSHGNFATATGAALSAR